MKDLLKAAALNELERQILEVLCDEPLSDIEFTRRTRHPEKPEGYAKRSGANRVAGNVGKKIFNAAKEGKGSPESRDLVSKWRSDISYPTDRPDWFLVLTEAWVDGGHWKVRPEIKAAFRELYGPDESSETEPNAIVLGTEYMLEDLGGASRGAHFQRIGTPSGQPFVDLFTEKNADPFSCKDGFRDDGVFVCAGERQTSYAGLEGANLAVRDSATDGKQLRLFEKTKEGKARFAGYAVYLSHQIAQRADSTGELRSAILFELEVSAQASWSTHAGVNAGVASVNAPDFSDNETLAGLRIAALLPSPSGSTPKARLTFVYYRSKAVKKYVWMRAKGTCEGCQKSAPFVNRRQEAFLEPHHTTRLADGGPDHPAHVIALCPNCHREVHHGADGEKLNEKFIVWLRTKENGS